MKMEKLSMTNTYTIYKRITPDNYVYVGCTVRDLAVRAGYKGAGYIGQPVYDKIQEAGWENIITEIIAQTDNMDEAKRLESEAIQAAIEQYGKDHILNSELNSHYAWNDVNRKTTGASSKAVKRSAEWKAKIAATVTEQWKDEERKTQIINAMRQNWQNKSKEEMDSIRAKSRERINQLLADLEFREKHKQRCSDPARRAKLSESLKNSEKVKASANSPERNEKLRNSLKAYFTEEVREQMSIRAKQSENVQRACQDPARKAKIAEASRGCKWINNGVERHFVKGETLEQYLAQGWELGWKLK